ncbi:MAG: dUTP diphosphatase [Betaproteobacteria bacterium]|nr:dUTP diphosphatase [Betaproteobacteria bacterium]
MIGLQEEMNLKVNHAWRTAGYPWHRAIWTECAEMLDHVGWKWWKDLSAQPDVEQIRLEVIDIWHFGMSDLMGREIDNHRLARGLADAYANSARLSEKQPLHDLIEAVARHTLAERSFDPQPFFSLAHGVELDIDSLYRRYVGKNVLNFFRQDNGYKAGTYRKTWSGREDNEHLSEIIATLDADAASFRDDVYRALAGRYAQ